MLDDLVRKKRKNISKSTRYYSDFIGKEEKREEVKNTYLNYLTCGTMSIVKEEYKMIEYRYDTQLLIEGKGLDEDAINDYFEQNLKGDCLLAVGDDELIKIHFHTNEPWKVLEYCSTLGEIYDIVVEDMDRQSRGLKG